MESKFWLKSFFHVIILITFTFLISGIITPSLGYSNANMPNGNTLEYFEFSEETDKDYEYEHANKLVLYEEKTAISFISAKPYSVYILNETQMLNYLNNQPFTSKKKWENTTKFEVEISFSILQSEFNLENYSYQEGNDDPQNIIPYWILIHNEVEENNHYSLRVDFSSDLNQFLFLSARHLLFIAFLSFGTALIIYGKSEKKGGEDNKAHIAYNWGFGLLTGGFATLTWEILGWYSEFYPQNTWDDVFAFPEMPIVWIYGNYLTFISLGGLGLSILFMSNSVERDVQMRKIPYLTYFLLLMEILIMVGIVLIPILEAMIYIWIVSVALAAFNIFGTFLKLIWQTTGDVKKKASLILLGIFITYSSLVLRDFIRPDYIMNSVAIVGTYILYKGVKYQ